MQQNTEWRSVLISVGIMVLGVLVAFIPTIFGIDGFDGGFALVLLGGVIVIGGIVSAIVFTRQAMVLGSILAGQDLLAHWTYSQAEWDRYAQKEAEEDTTEKKTLFYIVAGFALLFGIGFFIYDHDAGRFVLLVMVALIVLIGAVALLTAAVNRRRNRAHLGEAYIARGGVYLNRVLYAWRGMGAQLEGVVYDADSQSLEFKYVALERVGPHLYSVRVPVPAGQEEAALKIATDLNS